MKKLLLISAAVSIIAGAPAAQAAITTYNVTDTFYQLSTGLAAKGNNTIFQGSFSFDDTLSTFSWLGGMLSESMTGNVNSGIPQTLLPLNYLKATQSDGLGGLLVSVFYKDSTDVFLNGGYNTGGTKQYLDANGVANNNAYVTFDFNLANPTSTLSSAQILNVAYGDCAAGGLMGMGTGAKTCMTGYEKLNTLGVHVAGGTMMGTFPTAQTIAAVPEPETYAMMLAGLGLMGFTARRRRMN